MINISQFLPFILSLALGAILGLEREFGLKTYNKEDNDILGGVRTYSLVSLLGTIAAFIDSKFIPGIAMAAFIGIILLTGISYMISYYKKNECGITSEISIIICFIIGMIVQKDSYILAAFITVLVMVVLYLKEYLKKITSRVQAEDLNAVLKFGIMTFVILPFFDPKGTMLLKDLGIEWINARENIANLELLNLHTVWLMVVLISGIGFTGYISTKILGSRKGTGLTGFLGGLVSSTATTVTFSKRSKDTPVMALSAALAVMLACSTMFPRILVEVSIVNSSLLPSISIMMGSMALAGFAFCIFLWKKSGNEKSDDVPLKNPFNIMPAVKFGMLYAIIVFLARLFGELTGESGLYIVSVLSGLTDVDAITLTMSQLSKNDPAKLNQAAVSITLAAFSNTILKAAMASCLGSPQFRKKIILGFAVIVSSGIASLLIFAL